METIYLGLHDFPREWCSKKTDLDSYFMDYSKTYREIIGKKETVTNILNAIWSDSVLLTDKDIQNLGSITDENELKFFNTKMKKRNLLKSKKGSYNRRNLKNINKKVNVINGNISHAKEKASSSPVPMKTGENMVAANLSNSVSRGEKNESGDILNTVLNNLVNDELGIFDLSSLTEKGIFPQNSPGMEEKLIEKENDNFRQTLSVDKFNELCLTYNTSDGIFQYDRTTENMPSTSKRDLRQDYFSEIMPNNEANQPLNSFNTFQQANFFKDISQINKPKNRLNFSTLGSNRCHVMLEKPKTKVKSFDKGERFLVSFRIHQPFMHKDDNKIEKMRQEILLLNTDSLENLRDKIICQSDYQDVQGDLSECPDASIKFMSRDIYPSAMFYLDNTFYIDNRYENCRDYSSVIRSWALPRGIPVGDTKDMSSQLIGQLKIRFGYPYVYMHQGCCEHLVIINDARLVTGNDPLKYQSYPLMSSLSRNFVHNCGTCSTQPASWLVEDYERTLLNINYMCKTCFTRFYYKDGSKIGNFKAFRFYQETALM